MKFQIECNTLQSDQICLVCNQQLQMGEARLIVCNDYGDSFGDICPHCIAMGSDWISSQLQQISYKPCL